MEEIRSMAHNMKTRDLSRMAEEKQLQAKNAMTCADAYYWHDLDGKLYEIAREATKAADLWQHVLEERRRNDMIDPRNAALTKEEALKLQEELQFYIFGKVMNDDDQTFSVNHPETIHEVTTASVGLNREQLEDAIIKAASAARSAHSCATDYYFADTSGSLDELAANAEEKLLIWQLLQNAYDKLREQTLEDLGYTWMFVDVVGDFNCSFYQYSHACSNSSSSIVTSAAQQL